jgi:hypothetical protein
MMAKPQQPTRHRRGRKALALSLAVDELLIEIDATAVIDAE